MELIAVAILKTAGTLITVVFTLLQAFWPINDIQPPRWFSTAWVVLGLGILYFIWS